jgi:hypothetical protein
MMDPRIWRSLPELVAMVFHDLFYSCGGGLVCFVVTDSLTKPILVCNHLNNTWRALPLVPPKGAISVYVMDHILVSRKVAGMRIQCSELPSMHGNPRIGSERNVEQIVQGESNADDMFWADTAGVRQSWMKWA